MMPSLMAQLMLGTLLLYFALLFGISRLTSRRESNAAFFTAERKSPWPLVAFGMIGASISGVSFISVPGWVAGTGMTYLQMCAGFFFGYLIVAFLLLPLYYKLGLTSIYSYLGSRFGNKSRHTGASFFLLSKILGASARLYLAIFVLHTFITAPIGISFEWTAFASLCLIWLYTRRSGIKTIVRTDALQTLCMLLALGGILWAVIAHLDVAGKSVVDVIRTSPYNYVWAWEGKQSFWRQFFSGIFIVIAMTGLDQDMMQKNLTCKNLKAAQKDMCAYGFCFLPVNFVFLVVGILLYAYCESQHICPPTATDQLLPYLISNGHLGTAVILPFSIGIVAAAFSSADSALTSLTTTFCMDWLHFETDTRGEAFLMRRRKWVHLGMTLLFLACILLYKILSSGNVLNAIYVMASYSYGPLIGLYAFGMFTHRKVKDNCVPYICLLAPIICGILDYTAPLYFNYHFGYELLMLNGGITFLGLWGCSTSSQPNKIISL